MDPNSTRRKGVWVTLAIAAVTCAGAVAIASDLSEGRSAARHDAASSAACPGNFGTRS